MDLIRKNTVSGAGFEAGGLRIVPVARSWKVQLPGRVIRRGFIRVRPLRVEVSGPGSPTRKVRVTDATRRSQLKVAALPLALSLLLALARFRTSTRRSAS